MWKIKWKIYGKLSWRYCRKAEKLINNSDKMNPDKYGKRLNRYINMMMLFMDKRLKCCL